MKTSDERGCEQCRRSSGKAQTGLGEDHRGEGRLNGRTREGPRCGPSPQLDQQIGTSRERRSTRPVQREPNIVANTV